MKSNFNRKNSGQVLIIALIFMMIILVLTGALMDFVGQNIVATRRALAKEQALQLADAGVDRAVRQLNQTAGSYTGETGTSLSTGQFDVTVANLSSSLKEITSTGYVPNKTNPVGKRQVKVQVSVNTTNANFFYGVQVGDGGLVMDNNSSVIGNVYSNGTIDGSAGASITGDGFSAGSSGRIFDRLLVGGNAHAHALDTNITVGGSAYGQVIDGISITGNAFTNSLSNCSVGGNAFYTSISSCSVGGTLNPGYPGEADPAPQTLPITDQQITDWKNAADAGGTINGDYTIPINQTVSLGPKKITGNLVVSQNAKLILTGTIWVMGNITTSNNSTVQLDPLYGNGSEVVVSDAVIDVVNNTVFQRAGPISYIMMLTTRVGDDSFRVANNSNALIAYAGNGKIVVLNNATLREVTGWKIHLNNNASITYETGLSNVNFSGGPGGFWAILRGTWREIK